MRKTIILCLILSLILCNFGVSFAGEKYTTTINKNLDMDEQYVSIPNITTRSAHMIPGKSQYDDNNWGSGKKAYSKIYSKCVMSDGFWEGVVYSQFEGYGYTEWQGTGTPLKVKSGVTVSATGVLPQISYNGSNWSLLTNVRDLGETEKKKSKSVKHSYYDVKIQSITALSIVFKVNSYIDHPTLGGMNATEDVWWWN
ncbi:hypothetical protein [Aminipila terrae]|uniref:Uncharacterized protein n=1 Tax=Aminipila terrae TaxID=2697030 RepID=A0A6P1MIP4_9FIRM|nr:hypothetical protein [Aminipila terrae]QHI72484.1 hypothetical protein Ami3637_08830 [Aminipila terrae]